MGYAIISRSATAHLMDKLTLSITAQLAPILDVGGTLLPLAKAYTQNTRLAGISLLPVIQLLNNITVESTDAQIDAAVVDAVSIALLKEIYNIV